MSVREDNREPRLRQDNGRDPAGQALHAAAPLADGRYHLIEVLGEGGMATVYRGFDVRLQVSRAVKVLSPNLAGRRALRERFEAEARTMALFDHPNIVRVVDVGMDGERVYIIMELVAGGSLLERVRDFGPLPARLALDVMIETLKALQAAHEHGVVHRDIKPHNILLTDKGQVRVTDFGIARLIEGDDIDDALTRTGAVMGTWGFMAPEQKENAKAVDARADLYSAGATLWAIVTNQTPGHLFAADLDATMMQGVPDALADLIKRSTRYKREDRFASAAEMLEAAQAVRELIPAPPPDTPPLGARAVTPPLRTQPLQPASTRADGPPPPEERPGATMVPDMTPAPEDRVRVLSAAPTQNIESDLTDWEVDPSSVSRADSEEQGRRQLRTFVLLGLLAVLVAGAVGLALPSTVEPHGSGSIGARAESTAKPAEKPLAVEPASPPERAGATAETAPATTTTTAVATTTTPSATGAVSSRSSKGGGSSTRSAPESRAPGLSHSPVQSAKAGQQVEIRARLVSAPDYKEVLLNYRALGSTVWSNQPMFTQGDALVGSLAVAGPLAGGFEYFILARSDNPDLPALSSGSFRAPYKVTVQ